MLSRTALIVDDERDIRELVGLALSRMGLRVESAGDLAEARAQLARHDFDLCLTDMRLPDGNGLALIEHIADQYPDTPVAMMTAYGNIEAAVAALKAGAFDFVTKPVDLAVLRQLVTHALNLGVQRRAAELLAAQLPGDSEALRQLRERIGRAARSQAPVLLDAAPGPDLARVARLIHAHSPRQGGPFVSFDCSTRPASAAEAGLFGSAEPATEGFVAAHGGSLFLEHLEALPAPLQTRLLRSIEAKALHPGNGGAAQPLDVRLIASGGEALAQAVADGQFLGELLEHLAAVRLPLPPLPAAAPEPGEASEREALIAALDAHRWHRTKTAEALGITFRALRYKLKKYGIE